MVDDLHDIGILDSKYGLGSLVVVDENDLGPGTLKEAPSGYEAPELAVVLSEDRKTALVAVGKNTLCSIEEHVLGYGCATCLTQQCLDLD